MAYPLLEKKQRANEASKRYRLKYPERVAARMRKYKKDNPEIIKAIAKRDRTNNAIQVAARLKKFHENNPDYQKNYDLKRGYGISLAEYNRILELQGGLCAICLKPETAMLRGVVRYLAVDHDHSTNEVRGLLCTNCNNMLGRVQDNVETLKSAISYLQKGDKSCLIP